MKSKKLTDLCNPKQWKTIAAKELLEEGYPVYGANGIVGYWREYNHETETLAIACRGTCGTVNVIPPKSYINGNAMCLDNISDDVDLKYLFYYLKAYDFNKVISGTAVPQITIESLKKIDVLIPSKKEQKRIVYIFDILSQIIESKEKENKRYDDLIKARFIEMFGDPVSNSKHLPLKTLPQLGTFGRGVSKYRPRNAPELLNGPYPLIQTGDIANSELYIKNYNNTYSEVGLKQSKMWDKGTLCITIAANIAKTAILQFDACFPDSVVGFNGNNLTDNIFVHYWFSFFQEILENQAPESAQKNINLKILSELQIITPDIIEQNQFVNFVRQVDKSREAVKKSLEKTKQLYDSLMQEYFG